MKAKEEEKMKLLHLSDLHIGKRVNEFPMMEDQTYILKQILSVAEQEAADGEICMTNRSHLRRRYRLWIVS